MNRAILLVALIALLIITACDVAPTPPTATPEQQVRPAFAQPRTDGKVWIGTYTGIFVRKNNVCPSPYCASVYKVTGPYMYMPSADGKEPIPMCPNSVFRGGAQEYGIKPGSICYTTPPVLDYPTKEPDVKWEVLQQ